MRTFSKLSGLFALIFLTSMLIWVSGCRTTQSTLKVSNALKATKVLTLHMPESESGNNGFNGAGVVFHPGLNQWYAAFAGNAYFPLVVFNPNGKKIKDGLTTQYDVRGFWYNGKNKTIEGNAYGDGGIVELKLDSKGFPETFNEIFMGDSHQPSGNSVGAFDDKNDEILYFYDGEIQRYDRKNGEKIGTLGIKAKLNPYEINETTLIYTGYKGGEIGLLNYKTKKIILIDKSSGNQTGAISLPSDSPAPDMFNFAFAGGKIWLFDTESRNWYGYDVK